MSFLMEPRNNANRQVGTIVRFSAGISHVISAIVIQPGALNRFPHYLYTG